MSYLSLLKVNGKANVNQTSFHKMPTKTRFYKYIGCTSSTILLDVKFVPRYLLSRFDLILM